MIHARADGARGWDVQVGAKVSGRKGRGESVGPWLALQHRFLDKLVLSKMREPFGGNLRMAFAAGAPTPVPVLEFMEALGVRMTEGYGLTETSPVVSLTFPDARHRILGTVGPPIPGTELRLVRDGRDVAAGEEGELWVCGPQVMQGYWGKPEATAEVIVEEGGKRWFRTGDLVQLVHGNHIKITGRIKEQYKLENGKYVAPVPIEAAMSMSKFVLQVVLYGSGKPHNVAAIVPDCAAVALELGMNDWYDPKALCADPKVQALIEREAAKELNLRGVKKYEQPKAFLLIPEPFTVENEMLTPKLSIRKPNVVKHYQAELDALYK
jgi:long-chain acyl-CoA synthetase